MGTDIHLYIERKIEGVWTLIFPETLVQIRSEIEEDLDGDEDELTAAQKVRREHKRDLYSRFPGVMVDTYEDWIKTPASYESRSKNPLYVNRNYNLFAILADVRNGRGFAGVKTGKGFNPISKPKGIPADASPSYAWECEHWGEDGHSHSWMTVSELLAYDWDQITSLEGDVDSAEYRVFREKGRPDCWATAVWGRDIKHFSNEEMDTLLQEAGGDSSKVPGVTRVQWKASYRECVGSKFFTETLPALKQIGNPDDVRLVFFFDN